MALRASKHFSSAFLGVRGGPFFCLTAKRDGLWEWRGRLASIHSLVGRGTGHGMGVRIRPVHAATSLLLEPPPLASPATCLLLISPQGVDGQEDTVLHSRGESSVSDHRAAARWGERRRRSEEVAAALGTFILPSGEPLQEESWPGRGS